MEEDRAAKIVSWGIPIAIIICIVGAILEWVTKTHLIYPIFALVALAIMLHCYVIGKQSFPEWSNKKPVVR